MKTSRFLAVIVVAAGVCFAGGMGMAKFSNVKRPPEDGDEMSDPDSGPRKRLTALSTGPGGGGEAARQLAGLSQATDLGAYQRLCGYFRIVSDAEPHEMSALIATIGREVEAEFGGDVLINSAVMRWLETDPMGAFSELLTGGTPALDGFSEKIFAAIADADPHGAWDKFIALDADGGGGGAMGNKKKRDGLIAGLVASIGARDLDLALELVASIENPSTYRIGIGNALKQLAKSDPDRVLGSVDLLPFTSSFERGSVTGDAIANLAKIDPELARDRLEMISGSARRDAEWRLAIVWADADPAAALEWAAGLSAESQTRAKLAILRRQAASDPAAAAASVMAMESPIARANVAPDVARSWGNEDPGAAAAWVRGALEGPARERSYAALLESALPKVDFTKDFPLLKEMADGSPTPGAGHQKFARAWAAADPRAAAEWAVAWKKDPNEIFEEVATEWSVSDPAALQRFANSLDHKVLKKIAARELKRAAAAANDGEGSP